MSDYLEIVREVLREQQITHPPEQGEPLESVLKGKAVELYLTDGDRFFIVADVDDARPAR
jgi:hypothetical protein